MTSVFRYSYSLYSPDKRHPQKFIDDLCASQGVKVLAYQPRPLGDDWLFDTDKALNEPLPEYVYHWDTKEPLTNEDDRGVRFKT